MKDNIKNVVFDVGMVLIDFCWEQHCRDIGLSDEVIKTFEKYMINSKYWGLMDEGLLTEEDALLKFKEEMPQYVKEIDRFWEHPEKLVREYDFASPLVDELHDKGYYVYLLSNYPLGLYKIHWPLFDFYSKVDGYVVSAAEKLCKPNPAIYNLLCERYNLKPEECVFFDDRQENIDAATRVGMEGILFEGEHSVRNLFF